MIDTEQFVADRLSGMSLVELGQKYNLTLKTVWDKLKISGIGQKRIKKGEKKVYKSRIDNIKALALYSQGLSDGKIGEAFEVGARAIQTWREKNNLPSLWQRATEKGAIK